MDLAVGTAALQAGDWLAARDAFTACLEQEETPEALNGLGDALWWLGETHASIEHRERAYAAYRKRGDASQAASIALNLTVHYRANVGNEAAAKGWLARARRLVDEETLEDLRGWIALFEAGDASDPVEGERLSRATIDIARATGDLDLELCAIAQTGSFLISLARIDEGVAMLDEAMAGSLGGEGGSFDTVVFTSCNMIGSCTRCADFERAVQWIRAADRFTKRYGCPFLYLYCRTHYGAILIATGDWAEADAQLTSALREAEGAQVPLSYFACATLATLRFVQGRLEEAESLIEGFDGMGPAAPVEAALHLARGKPAAAEAVARRALDGADPLERSRLAELIGEARIALGDAAAAAIAGRELIATGDAERCELVRARGNRLAGRASGSREHLDAAIGGFSRLGMPHEVARTRLMLAELLRTGEPEVAEAEARAALGVFEGLGAGRDADAAAALLRDLGVKAARSGPKSVGALSKRETEVLGLLREGLTNPEIAERLYLSRKTVEHHVASILQKLGARNRADAVRLSDSGSK